MARQEIDRRRLHIGLVVEVGAHRRDEMGRISRGAERDLLAFGIADITILQRLAPGPVAGCLEHQDRLAVMVEGVERCAGVSGASHRGASHHDPRGPAFGVTAGGHAPAESRIGEIIAIDVEPRVEHARS